MIKSVRKYFLLLLLFFLLATTSAKAAIAPIAKESIPPSTDSGSLIIEPIRIDYPTPKPMPSSFTPGISLLSLFDKRGNSQTVAKIIFDEADKDLLRKFTFTLPAKGIDLIRIVHEKQTLKRSCPEYYEMPQPTLSITPRLEPMPEGPSPKPYILPPNCSEYYVFTYTTVTPTTEETTDGLKVTVRTTPNLYEKAQESLLFLYRGDTNTRKLLTNFYFTLETPKVPLTATSVYVGILVKEGLYIRGSTPYPGPYSSYYLPNFRALEKARSLVNEEDPELNTLSNDINYQGAIRQSDSDLPSETSFIVKGVYGSSFLLLYLKEIAFGIAAVVLFVGLIIFLTVKFLKNNPHKKAILVTVIISVLLTLTFVLAALLFFILKFSGWLPFPLYK